MPESPPPCSQPSPRRWQVLVGPQGHLTCLPVGDPRRADRYRAFTPVAEFNRPLTPARAQAARAWAVWALDL